MLLLVSVVLLRGVPRPLLAATAIQLHSDVSVQPVYDFNLQNDKLRTDVDVVLSHEDAGWGVPWENFLAEPWVPGCSSMEEYTALQRRTAPYAPQATKWAGWTKLKNDDEQSGQRYFRFNWGLGGSPDQSTCARRGVNFASSAGDPATHMSSGGGFLRNVSLVSPFGFGLTQGTHMEAGPGSCADGISYSNVACNGMHTGRHETSTCFDIIPSHGICALHSYCADGASVVRYGSQVSLRSVALKTYLSAESGVFDEPANTSQWTIVDPHNLDSTALFTGGTFALRAGVRSASSAPSPPAWDGIASVEVFTHGVATRDASGAVESVSNYCVRIPVLMMTGSETLLAFAESRPVWGRADGCNPLAPPPPVGRSTWEQWKNIIMSRSSTAGRTWSAPITVCVGCGQPQAVFDATRNRTLLLSVRNKRNSQQYSTDDGLSFSSVANCSGTFPQVLMAGPGSAVQLSKRSSAAGRIVGNGWTVQSGTSQGGGNQAFFSDSGGESWAVSKTLVPMVDESQLVERADGVLMMFSRNFRNCSKFPGPPYTTGNCIGVTLSHDSAETWGTTVFDARLLSAQSQISVLRHPTQPNTMLFSAPTAIRQLWSQGCGQETPGGSCHPNWYGARVRGRVQISTSGGKTWGRGPDGSGGVVITNYHPGAVNATGHWADTFGYSCLSATPNNAVGLLFEAGTPDCVGPYGFKSTGACAIRFATIPLHSDDAAALKVRGDPAPLGATVGDNPYAVLWGLDSNGST